MATEIGSPASDSKTVAVEDAGSVELAAPEGWKKKAVPRKGSTPGIKMAVFISPTGEEITNKRQLNQYLRAHPGGPRSSEFDWGTGDTPRRSSRIGAKAKATESPEEEKPPKKERKSSSSTKKKKENKNDDETANASDESKKEVKDTEGNTKDNEQSEKPAQPQVDPVTSVVVEGKEEVKPEDETMTEAIKDENTGKKIEDINKLPEEKQDDGKAEDENKEKDEDTVEKNEDSCSMAEDAIKDEKTEKKVEDSDMLPEGKQVDKQEDESKEKEDGFNVLPERKENENAKENTETVEIEKAKAEVFASDLLPERNENENENAAEKKSDDQTGEFKPIVQQPQTSVN